MDPCFQSRVVRKGATTMIRKGKQAERVEGEITGENGQEEERPTYRLMIRDMAPEEKPRERLMLYGVEALANRELLGHHPADGRPGMLGALAV